MKTITCQRCKGKGYYYKVLKDHSGKSRDGMGVQHIVTCDQTACERGQVDIERYYQLAG